MSASRVARPVLLLLTLLVFCFSVEAKKKPRVKLPRPTVNILCAKKTSKTSSVASQLQQVRGYKCPTGYVEVSRERTLAKTLGKPKTTRMRSLAETTDEWSGYWFCEVAATQYGGASAVKKVSPTVPITVNFTPESGDWATGGSYSATNSPSYGYLACDLWREWKAPTGTFTGKYQVIGGMILFTEEKVNGTLVRDWMKQTNGYASPANWYSQIVLDADQMTLYPQGDWVSLPLVLVKSKN
jgi:hypothetical protein